jgi:uncharacterized protein
MKILAISDIVDGGIYSQDLKSRFGDVDLVLSAGDLPYSYLEFIVSILNKPLLYVRGNHLNLDEWTSEGSVRKEPAGCINIHGKTVLINGLLIGGIQGSMRYNKGPYQYTETQIRGELSKLIPFLLYNKLSRGRYLDILLTHAPASGIGDEPDTAHSGFKSFLDFMKIYTPSLMVHGHVHLYDRNSPYINSYGSTTIINTYGHRLIQVGTGSNGAIRTVSVR